MLGRGPLLINRALDIEYLATAKGANGGSAVAATAGLGGGGGAGELKFGSMTLFGGQTISAAFSGNDLVLSGALSGTLKGGGAGAAPNSSGSAGGGGGGGGNGSATAGGASTASFGQGTPGGAGTGTGGPAGFGNAGAGGGATGGVLGSDGYVSSINGSSVEYARGGTGGSQANGATPGSGGGGADGMNGATVGLGAAGVLIIRYLGGQRATGGTITSAGGYTIHTFTSNGTFDRI